MIDNLIAALGSSEGSRAFEALRRQHDLRRDKTCDSVYWENRDRGIAASVEANLVDAVFLFGSGKDGYTAYQDELPGGITFEDRRERARELFGEPASSSIHQTLGNGFASGGWDRYELDTHILHLTYATDTGKIELVTLMCK